MWQCPLLELERRSLSFPKEATPDGVPSHGGGQQAAPVAVLAPVGFLWALSPPSPLRGAAGRPLPGFRVQQRAPRRPEEARRRWNISVSDSVLLRCLEILNYSAEKYRVGSFCLPAG